jgi:hypothetical protein
MRIIKYYPRHMQVVEDPESRIGGKQLGKTNSTFLQISSPRNFYKNERPNLRKFKILTNV